MPSFIYLYLLSIPLFFVIDMLWLGWLGRGVYQHYIGHMLGSVQWGAAIGFYLLYLVGVTYFASYPAFLQGSVLHAAGLGALFGFFTYMTYDMTNLATLDGWPWQIVVIDVLWGTILGASVSAGAVAIMLQYFG
jgi:uncharacterized membrane protein